MARYNPYRSGRSAPEIIAEMDAMLADPEYQRECREGQARLNAMFDAHRDRALLRRDVNEALETITLETLAEAA